MSNEEQHGHPSSDEINEDGPGINGDLTSWLYVLGGIPSMIISSSCSLPSWFLRQPEHHDQRLTPRSPDRSTSDTSSVRSPAGAGVRLTHSPDIGCPKSGV